MKKHIHIDPFSGIAGDMFLGALLDLGLSLDALKAALAPLPVQPGFHLSADRVLRQGISGIDFKVRVEHEAHHHDHDHNHTHGHHHHHTHHGDIVKMIELLPGSQRTRDRARKVLDLLAHAEATVHHMPVEKVHFHEVGAVDSIVDMLGVAMALELLEIDTISCGPLPLSRGYVHCDHGRMPVPAPATANLMCGLPTYGVDRVGELVTPTGAALVAGLADHFGPAPPMVIHGVGYGAGDRDEPEVPNLLRIFIGELRPGAKLHRHEVTHAHHHEAPPTETDHHHDHEHAHAHSHDKPDKAGHIHTHRH